MLAPETVTFLEGGCALIVGTVGADGEPHAGRGWGVTVLSPDPAEIRLLIDADDALTIAHLSTNVRVAVTGADVQSLHSTQLKGIALTVEPGTDVDRARAARFTDAFFGDIEKIDGTPRALMDQLVPRDFVVCVVRATELYDQTPGPSAGTVLAEDES